eukprot:CAMPEP_0184984562 /NCGR_PEP_ID=MMETSP1098-20130426/13493_1 /TAXON_ID=89044 /ORGANISM="Spumella elongata, Strain CCAP 955/1" /LENGTH=941 /DNA_ID=CAMNT_0027508569 /DNA_START=116 /DNA_END=2941 /DNA_ORIENTATION=+
MKLVFSVFVAAFLGSLQVLLAEVTVLRAVQVIYDKSPKLRIKGSGFDAQDHDINLEIGASGQPLIADKDYMVTKDSDGDGLILKLLGNRKWVDLSSRTPPVAIVLTAVKFASAPDKNLLAEPVIVAQVLSAPSVNGNDDILYQTASNELRINGTGFIGAKKVDLYFQPPLVKEVAYEDVTPYPLTKNQVVLRLRHGYSWRETPGALFVIGVDTGAGPVKVDGDAGAKVAEVVDNHDLHSVTVEPTVNEQLVYADQADITITGTGFNPVGNLFRFANGLLGNNVNYTTISTTDNKVKLRLTPGSHWRKNMENLPGALTLVAVNAGAGFVAVGPINSAKGRDVAMIFERPEVHSDQKKIYRTHSHELHIIGQGFPDLESGYKVQLKFQPALVENVDYTMRVVDRTELELTLLDGRAWRPDAGGLMVTHINTRGDGAGWVDLPGAGVHVAEVVEDIDAATTGGIEIFPMGVKVYQSANRETIDITGTGFKDGLSLILDPPMQVNSDYTLEVVSKNKIVLKLKGNKKWRAEPGFIIARSVKVDNKEYALAGTEGIRVAIVLADPVITTSKETLHETQSKLLVISGTGFTNVADVKITLNPTPSGSYKVIGVLEDAIRVQLKPDNDWLPSFMTLKDEEDSKKILLSVTSIDTGAGEIKFDPAVSIGYIIKDREGVVCDDSCEFAFDGVCDDGSEPNDEYYYQNYFNYQDDDMGGFYYEGEDGEEGGKDGNEAYGEDGEDSQYGVAYDDYYMENEDYQVSACVEGTDCTDCGGVDAIIDYTQPLDPNSGIESCTNTCIYPRDGVCDDPRGTKYCELGTDCQDCGPIGADNFTRSDDDGWWDDDDDYWTFNDANFVEQNNGLEKNRHKVKTFKREEVVSTTDIFLVVLEGMVYTVGAIFAAAALYLLNRWYKGQSVPFMNAFSPELNQREFDLRPQQRMPITPDEFRT